MVKRAKKGFIDMKHAVTFRLVPGGAPEPVEDPQEAVAKKVPGEKFQPTQEQIKEQHDAGIFFDDDYDYLKHLKSREDKCHLLDFTQPDEDRIAVVKASRGDDFFPAPPAMLFGDASSSKKKMYAPVYDDDINRLLEVSNVDDSCDQLEDNFLELAGGVVESANAFSFRDNNAVDDTDDEDDDDYEDAIDYSHGAQYEYSGNVHDAGYGDEDDRSTIVRHHGDRELDTRFDQLLDADYNDEQLGELETDEFGEEGVLEPNDPRILKMLGMKRSNPDYDEECAKDYIRNRLRYLEAKGEEEKETMETVEVDVCNRKRMKWDCESFATQYTNIYNHPTVIRELQGKLSKRALKRLDKDRIEEEDEEMEEDEESDDGGESMISTVSTFRPKDETPEQRRLRKAAVKEAQRVRRQEKKQNKVAFSEEARRLKKSELNRVKGKRLL